MRSCGIRLGWCLLPSTDIQTDRPDVGVAAADNITSPRVLTHVQGCVCLPVCEGLSAQISSADPHGVCVYIFM